MDIRNIDSARFADLQPNTLSQDNFADADPNHMVDVAEDKLLSEANATLAEQQIHNELQASTQIISVAAPSQMRVSPMSTPSKTQNVWQPNSPQDSSSLPRAIEQTTGHISPQRVLGKRSVGPGSPNMQNKRSAQFRSRFQFSQDEPVSQNPALVTANSRKEFLKGQRATRQNVTLSPAAEKEHTSYRLFNNAQETTDVRPRSPQPHPDRRQLILTPSAKVPSSPPKYPTSPKFGRFGPPNIKKFQGRTTHGLPAKPPPSNYTMPTSVSRPQVETIAKSPATIEDTLFKEFVGSYPAYDGDRKHFMNMARMIHRLVQDGRMLHSSTWDDFVVRHKSDYLPYNIECVAAGDEAMSYDIFYLQRVDEPQHRKKVLQPAKLHALLTVEDERYVHTHLTLT